MLVLEIGSSRRDGACPLACPIHVILSQSVLYGKRETAGESFRIPHETEAFAMGHDMQAVAVLHNGVQFKACTTIHWYLNDFQVFEILERDG